MSALIILVIVGIIIVLFVDRAKTIRASFGYYIVFYSLTHGFSAFSDVLIFAETLYINRVVQLLIEAQHSTFLLPTSQGILMCLVFLYIKMSTVAAQRMSESFPEHYCYIFLIMLL